MIDEKNPPDPDDNEPVAPEVEGDSSDVEEEKIKDEIRRILHRMNQIVKEHFSGIGMEDLLEADEDDIDKFNVSEEALGEFADLLNNDYDDYCRDHPFLIGGLMGEVEDPHLKLMLIENIRFTIYYKDPYRAVEFYDKLLEEHGVTGEEREEWIKSVKEGSEKQIEIRFSEDLKKTVELDYKLAIDLFQQNKHRFRDEGTKGFAGGEAAEAFGDLAMKLVEIVEEIYEKDGLDGAIDFYLSLPSDQVGAGRVAGKIHDFAWKEAEIEHGVQAMEDDETMEVLMREKLKGAPSIALRRAADIYSDYSDKFRGNILEDTLAVEGEDLYLIQLLGSKRIDGSVLEKHRDKFFLAYLKYDFEALLNEMGNFTELFTALPPEEKERLLGIWRTKNTRRFIQALNELGLPEERRSAFAKELFMSESDVLQFFSLYKKDFDSYSSDERERIIDFWIESHFSSLVRLHLIERDNIDPQERSSVIKKLFVSTDSMIHHFEEYQEEYDSLSPEEKDKAMQLWLKDEEKEADAFFERFDLFDLGDEDKKRILITILGNNPQLIKKSEKLFEAIDRSYLAEAVTSAEGEDGRLAIRGFIGWADLELYEEVMSPTAFSRLRESVSRFREPLTGSEDDKVKDWLLGMNNQVEDFNFSDSNIENVAAFLDVFGLQQTPRLYEYFSNIQSKQRGEIDELPAEQLATGLDSVEKLQDRLSKMREMLIEGSIPSSEEMTDLDYDILAIETNFHTSRWSRPEKNVKQMYEKFEKEQQAGKIAEVPKEYTSVKIEVERIKSKVEGLSDCKDEYKHYRTELLGAELLSKPNGLIKKQTQIAEAMNQEIASMQSKKVENEHQQRAQERKQQALLAAIEDIDKVETIDDLLKELLAVEDRLGIKKENSYTTPYIRQILFAKTMENHSGFEVLPESFYTPGTEPTLKGIQYIRDIIDNALKAHVLNEKEMKKSFKGDWKPSEKELKKMRKVFTSNKIKRVLRDLEGNLEGVKEEITMIPDRGFVGELAGYYSDACYTSMSSMLQKWPNVIPCKFVREAKGKDAEEGEKEIIGAVLLIESVAEDGEPVLIVRANNPQDKFLNKLQGSSFCETVYDAAEKYAAKRGITRVLVASKEGAESNREKIKTYVKDSKEGKEVVTLENSVKFNNYDLKNSCYQVRPAA